MAPHPLHRALLPGTPLPVVTLDKVGGGSVTTAPAAGRHLLVVVYRASFCPFCEGTLKELQGKLPALDAAGIDLIAVSADPLDIATSSTAEWGVTFPVGAGLTEAHMRQLGTYISDPRDYQPITWRFSEPAWFLAAPGGTIKYLDVASAPFGGRPNVDAILAGVAWSRQRVAEHPEFAGVVWGGVAEAS